MLHIKITLIINSSKKLNHLDVVIKLLTYKTFVVINLHLHVQKREITKSFLQGTQLMPNQMILGSTTPNHMIVRSEFEVDRDIYKE